MSEAPKSCPNCGVLITPQLVRCRQCKTYLHGSPIEGWLARLLPAASVPFPGVATLLITLFVFWFLLVVSTDWVSVLSVQSYSLRQFGAMHPPLILLGEYWRFVTSVLAHHDILHLAMNSWALVISGVFVERAYGGRKLVVLFWSAGILSMIGSFVWNTYAAPSHVFVTSSGASGAVCGLIGGALVAARRAGLKQATQQLWRWVFMLTAFGLLVPGIDNAAHGVGFVAGCAIAWPLSLRGPKGEPTGHTTVWRAGAAASVALAVACSAIAFSTAIQTPTTLTRDMTSRKVLMFTVQPGHSVDGSTQARLARACDHAISSHDRPEAVIDACMLSARAYPYNEATWRVLAAAEQARGDEKRAATLQDVADRVRRAINSSSAN